MSDLKLVDLSECGFADTEEAIEFLKTEKITHAVLSYRLSKEEAGHIVIGPPNFEIYLSGLLSFTIQQLIKHGMERE